jgi:hypothetical protein
LQNFLHACLKEANLSLVGRIAIRWDVVRFLSNLLRLSDEETRVPEVLDQPVARPIFISGLPRLGTTFLHSLLAEDPANPVPRVWQLTDPYPSVDAPFVARENFGIVLVRSRMLPICPASYAALSRRPMWEFAGLVHVTQSVLEALWKALVFLTPSRRLLRHTLLPLALRPRNRDQLTLPWPELCKRRL